MSGPGWQRVPTSDDRGAELLGPGHSPTRRNAPMARGANVEHLYDAYEAVAHDTQESAALQTDRRYAAEAELLDSPLLPAHKRRAVQRWTLLTISGIATAAVGILVSFGVTAIVQAKIGLILSVSDSELAGDAVWGSAFVLFVAINLGFALLAAGLGVLEPQAIASGLPEIKAYLNGVDMPNALGMRVLGAKVVGIITAMAGGLPVGNLGPMIHAGACVSQQVAVAAEMVPPLLDGGEGVKTRVSFKNSPVEMRDLVTCGAAAGVATAFGAPVGGVLFALEEGASFWTTKLTLRTFVTALTAAFVVHMLFDSETWGRDSQSAMFSFGSFTADTDPDVAAYSTWELFIFMILGSMGGLAGATFNAFNRRLALWRHERVTSRRKRIMEVGAISVLVSVVAFLLPTIAGSCITMPEITPDSSSLDAELVDALVPLYCHDDTQYNDLASLFLTSPDVTIKQLFHFSSEDETGDDNTALSETSLFLFIVAYAGISAVTYGSQVAAGLFLPMLLVGAAFGRLFGQLFDPLVDADAGVYALIGAAAMLGGMSRMTISVTVILLEATGDVQFGLPIILTLLPAKWIGDLFGESLYASYLRMRGLPFLPHKPAQAILHEPIKAVMAREVRTLPVAPTVGAAVDVLSGTSHHAFPVVDDGGRRLLGSVSRHLLCALLQRRAYAERGREREPVALTELIETELASSALQIPDGDRALVIDLEPYYSIAPHAVLPEMSVLRAYTLFRTMGLRHLTVVNHRFEVTGIVTRKDFLKSAPALPSRLSSAGGESGGGGGGGSGRRRRRAPEPQGTPLTERTSQGYGSGSRSSGAARSPVRADSRTVDDLVQLGGDGDDEAL